MNFPERHIVINYFFDNLKLNYHIDDHSFNDLKDLIPNNYSSFNSITDLSPCWLNWKSFSFPVFFEKPKDLFVSDQLTIDVFSNTFLLLSGYQEFISNDLDIHSRFKYQNSIQYIHNFVDTPVVNIYFEIFEKLAKKRGITLQKKVIKEPIVFTHDIDQLRSGWFEDIGYELRNFSFKSPFNISKSLFTKLFGLKDSYHQAYDKMLTIEKKHQVSAISFFMTEKSKKDADYDIQRVKYQKLIKNSHNEIGLHPGYYTYNNFENFEKQLRILSSFDFNVSKVRQHFLKFSIRETPYIHNKNKISEDYSLGFAEMYGFRNSIALPFYLYDFNKNKAHPTIEIPLFFMDGTISHYRKDKNREEEFGKVLQSANKILTLFSCKFSVLFHNTVFSEKKYKGFTKLYLDFIKLNKKFSND